MKKNIIYLVHSSKFGGQNTNNAGIIQKELRERIWKKMKAELY